MRWLAWQPALLTLAIAVATALHAPAAAQDLDSFRNPDPSATPVGLRFTAAVPIEIRRLIVDDLLWLAEHDTLADADDVAAFLGLGEDIGGPDLLAWLLHHVRLIAGESECLTERTLLMDTDGSGDEPAAGWLDLFGECERISAGNWAYVEGNPFSPRVAARFFGDEVVATGEATLPVIHIGRRMLQLADGDTFPERAKRLISLFHEAYHVAEPVGSLHVPCYRQNLLAQIRTFGRAGGPLGSAGNGCDAGPVSAYYLDGLMAELMVANCETCSTLDRAEIRDFGVIALMRVQLPLPASFRVPDDQVFTNLGLAGDAIQLVPPEAFFINVEALLTELNGEPPDWIVALHTLVLDQVPTDGSVPGFAAVQRSSRTPVLDPQASLLWIERAASAAADGYNVPVATVVHCSDLPLGCSDAWWLAIDRLENGVEMPFNLGADNEVELARFELDAAEGSSIRVRLAGSAAGIVLNLCELESRTCLSRVGGDDGAMIRWATAPAGEYGVWVDGFATMLDAPAARSLSLTVEW